jgi:hypothetical protein
VADLKTQWEKKGKEELSFYENTKRDRAERYYTNGSAPWFPEIKMNRRAFMPVNRMRAGHTSLKANLNRFNIVSTAECECGDGLKTEEHIFWDYKRHEDQRASMRDIVSENSKKEHPKSVTELFKARRKEICARRLLLHKQHSYIYLKIDKKRKRSKCTKY